MSTKYETLMEIEGITDEMAWLEYLVFDSICPGICTNPGCDYTTDVEPDSHSGWCEECETNTVESALSLKGLI